MSEAEEYTEIECSKEWGVGCGHVNDITTVRCTQCNNLLQTPPNARGEVFYYGQHIYFYRKSGIEVLEAGRCVCFTEDPSENTVVVRVKYAKDYVADKFDERHNISSIYGSIDLASSGSSRHRRKVSLYTEQVPPKLPAGPSAHVVGAGEHKAATKVKSKDKDVASTAKRSGRADTMDVDGDGDDDGEDHKRIEVVKMPKKLVRAPIRSFKSISIYEDSANRDDDSVSNSSSVDSFSAQNGTEPTTKKRGRANVGGGGSHFYNSYSFNNNNNQTGDFAGRVERSVNRHATMMKTLRRANLDDVFNCIVYDNAALYPLAATTLTNTAYLTTTASTGTGTVSYRVPLDIPIKRGLVNALFNWAVPIRLDAEIEELGAFAWKPDVFMIEVEEIVQSLPTTRDAMMRLNCAERLFGVSMRGYKQPKKFVYSTSSSSSSSSSSCNSDDHAEDDSSVGDALVEVVVKYLMARGFPLPGWRYDILQCLDFEDVCVSCSCIFDGW
jgi:hypothetical protein